MNALTEADARDGRLMPFTLTALALVASVALAVFGLAKCAPVRHAEVDADPHYGMTDEAFERVSPQDWRDMTGKPKP